MRLKGLTVRLGAHPAEALATGLGLSSTLGLLMLVPLLVGGYVDFDQLTLAHASALITLEVAAGILALGVAFLRAGNLSLQRLGRIGAWMAALAYFASMLRWSFAALALCRVISGLGVGLLGAAVNASTARSAFPERLYATGVFFYGAMSSVLLYLIPVLDTATGSGRPLFGAIAILFVLTALSASGLNDAKVGTGAEDPQRLRLRGTISGLRVSALLAGYLLMWIAFSMVWIFAERKAASIHMSPAETGLAMSACTVVGLLGSLVARGLGGRIGRAVPIAIGGAALVASFYAIGNALLPLVYWVAIIGYGVAYFFILPYILGDAAEADALGRVAMLASLVPWVSHLVSPLLGALVLVHFGAFPAMAGVTATTAAVATAILCLGTFVRNPAELRGTQ